MWVQFFVLQRALSTSVQHYSKFYESSVEAVADIRDDTSLLVGGFGLVGIPENLIRAVRDCGPKSLHVISNEAGLVVVSVPDPTNPSMDCF